MIEEGAYHHTVAAGEEVHRIAAGAGAVVEDVHVEVTDPCIHFLLLPLPLPLATPSPES